MNSLLSSFFKTDVPLGQLTTMGIGGPAKYFIEAKNLETLQKAFEFINTYALPFIILGKGSNILFDDRGFNGVVILNKINFLHYVSEETLQVGSGYSFSLLGTKTAQKDLSGLEFASGIPGSVGGAIFMNAGANGMDVSRCLQSVDFLHLNGALQTYSIEELSFNYRQSPFQKMQGAIVGATFNLKKNRTARQAQLDIIQYRRLTQPYHEKSAGCIFKNPLNGHASALIDQCGLKAKTIGGAEVSPMHANFIVNSNQASSQDILRLIDYVKAQVFEKTGKHLESEIRIIPYQED